MVRFVPGIVTETGTLLRRTPGTHSKPGAGIFDQVADRPWIEVAVITVTNYGRTPVSVSDVALDFGRQPWWKFWWRYTVSGHPAELHGGVGEASSYRLEPHDKLTAIYDFWGLVPNEPDLRSKTLKVRGSVLPARRWSWRKRSPWRHRVKVAPAQEAIWTDGPDHPLLETYRAVWRATAFTNPHRIYATWIGVSSLLTDFERGQPPDFLNPNLELPSLEDVANELQPDLGEIHALLEAAKILMKMPRATRPTDPDS